MTSRWTRRATALLVAAILSPPAAVLSAPSAAAQTDARSAAYDAYQTVLKPALAVPIGWSGSVAGCIPGAPSAAAQEATLTTINYFRTMVGLAPVTFDPALSAKAQQAALMMDAQNALSHTPPSTWACHTQEGAQAAGASNLYLGVTGAPAIAGYMVDPGSGNTAVGHRRWIMHPPRRTMGSGSTSDANALYVFGAQDPSDRGPEWVSWPPAGYLPVQLEPNGRWSLSADNSQTDFSAASVTVTRGGTPLPVQVQTVADGYGYDTLVWQLAPGYTAGQADQAFTVNVTNILHGSQVRSHSYVVTLFDGEVDTTPPSDLDADGISDADDDLVDVANDSFAYPYVKALVNAQVTAGCSGTPAHLMFCPDATVTRGDMAIFLARSQMGRASADALPPYAGGFSDVAGGDYYSQYVRYLVDLEVTAGCGGGAYCPASAVVRGDMSIFLARTSLGRPTADALPAYAGEFTDVAAGDYYAKAVKWAKDAGVTAGCGTGVFCPSAQVTRAQMAIFLVRAFNLPLPA